MNHFYIIEGFKNNDKKTILAYYEKLYPHILKLIEKDNGNKEDARNIIWQVFTLFRQQCQKPDFKVKNIDGYLYKMAQYLWKKELQKQQKDALSHQVEDDLDKQIGAIIDDEYLKHGEKEEAIKYFKVLLNQLSPNCKQIILMRFLYELPHEDIALRLNINVENSRQHLRRCIKRLAKIIDNQKAESLLIRYYPGIRDFIDKYGNGKE